MSTSVHFRNHCRVLRIAVLVVFVCLFLLMASGTAGLPWSFGPRQQDPGVKSLLSLVRFLPALGYLWALWAVQRALGDLAAGRLFNPAVARAVRHVGIGVLAGALLNVFAITNLSRWIAGGHGSYAYFDLSGIVLGVVGAALVLLSRLVDEARALQDELGEMF